MEGRGRGGREVLKVGEARVEVENKGTWGGGGGMWHRTERTQL